MHSHITYYASTESYRCRLIGCPMCHQTARRVTREIQMELQVIKQARSLRSSRIEICDSMGGGHANCSGGLFLASAQTKSRRNSHRTLYADVGAHEYVGRAIDIPFRVTCVSQAQSDSITSFQVLISAADGSGWRGLRTKKHPHSISFSLVDAYIHRT